MDLAKNGLLIRTLRKSKGLTQKDLAERLGVVPKTVSKWETGQGFPDVSIISSLADVFGVSERILLSGDLVKNHVNSGNLMRSKFFVCKSCGSVMQGVGDGQVLCCSNILQPLKAKATDDSHQISVSEIENDLYIEINHPMTKEHYIVFLAYVKGDRVITVRLYPEQDCAVRIPRIYGGKIVFYCNEHGLFEYIKPRKK